MAVELSSRLAKSDAMADLVNKYEDFVESELPRTAIALWDLSKDYEHRERLTLALSDPFGYAVTHFALDELDSQEQVRTRVHDLVDELLQSVRRERIEIRDTFASVEQIRGLQLALNAIPVIAAKKPKLFNRLQLSTEKPEEFFITEFAVEVGENVADKVRSVIEGCGFIPRKSSALDRPGIRERMRKLVATHLEDETNVPRYAICFRLQDPIAIHLLEIADDAISLDNGSLDGIGFIPAASLPGVSTLVLCLIPPSELRLAAEYNPGHPAIHGLRNRACWFVHPDDGGEAFYREFPELRPGSA